MELTSDEKAELKRIVSNDISLGAFSGMLFNAYRQICQSGEDTIVEDVMDSLIKEALTVRVKVRKLSQ